MADTPLQVGVPLQVQVPLQADVVPVARQQVPMQAPLPSQELPRTVLSQELVHSRVQMAAVAACPVVACRFAVRIITVNYPQGGYPPEKTLHKDVTSFLITYIPLKIFSLDCLDYFTLPYHTPHSMSGKGALQKGALSYCK